MCLEDLEEKDESLYQSISNKGDCRTAPGTPGLLKMLVNAIVCGCVLLFHFFSSVLFGDFGIDL